MSMLSAENVQLLHRKYTVFQAVHAPELKYNSRYIMKINAYHI